MAGYDLGDLLSVGHTPSQLVTFLRPEADWIRIALVGNAENTVLLPGAPGGGEVVNQ